jgi:dTDP-3-amino-3,4,6-trideoxy-alpha-D-glucose transaminase
MFRVRRASGGVTAPVQGDERVPFVALERQHAILADDLRDAFERVVGAGSFILGEEVEKFEAQFAEYCGASHCVGVASGTAALRLMLEASGIGPGDEVIVPAHTFIASALAVTHAGATPVLCDVEADTGLIDPDAIRAMVGPRTAAVLAVHLYGQACDMDAIEEVARPHGLLVLEDAAQAHGATYSGRHVGSLGAAAAFSFYPSKNLGAFGDGGAVCTSDECLAAQVRRLRHLGQSRKGQHEQIGYNERLDGLQAALLSVKLPYLDSWNALRRERADSYRAMLKDSVGLLVERLSSPCTYHLFPIRVAGRDEVASLMSTRGIDVGIHYAPAVHRHRAWASRDIRHGSVDNADAWAAEELSLPMHPYLRDDEVERVVEGLTTTLAAEAA